MYADYVGLSRQLLTAAAKSAGDLVLMLMVLMLQIKLSCGGDRLLTAEPRE